MERRAELDAAGALVTPDGARISRLEITPEMVRNRTTVIYGPSGTGKTVIAKHLMSLAHPAVPQVLVVSPSEPSNRAYAGFVDPALIHYSLSLEDPADRKGTPRKAALRFLNAIWDRQELMTAVAARADDLRPLAALFRRTPAADRVEGLRAIRAAAALRARVAGALAARYAAEPGRAAEKRKEVEEKFQRMLRLIYKKFVARHREALWRDEALTEDERFCLDYLEFNPGLLLVFDDCAADLKALFASNEFKRIFYRGRHVSLTTILIAQDDTDLPTNLRKNAFLSIFTEAVVCRSNFDRGSNNFPRPTRAFVGEVIPAVFAGNRKLVYIREDPRGENFYHFEAPFTRPFRFGSDALHELCDAVKAEGATMDAKNPYYRRFRPDAPPGPAPGPA